MGSTLESVFPDVSIMTLFRRVVTIDQERDVGGVTVLSLCHDLVEAGDCLLRRRIEELVALGRERILLDLGLVGNMDSSDIGRLIRAHLMIRRTGGRIHLCNLLPGVRTLLATTRLDTVFELHESEEQGVEALNGRF